LLENGHGWVIYEYEPLVLRTWSFSSAAALPALHTLAEAVEAIKAWATKKSPAAGGA
jgi:hypothetical protein